MLIILQFNINIFLASTLILYLGYLVFVDIN